MDSVSKTNYRRFRAVVQNQESYLRNAGGTVEVRQRTPEEKQKLEEQRAVKARKALPSGQRSGIDSPRRWR